MTPTDLFCISLVIVLACTVWILILTCTSTIQSPANGIGPALGIGTGIWGMLVAIVWFCLG